jgi:hypothetical protein
MGMAWLDAADRARQLQALLAEAERAAGGDLADADVAAGLMLIEAVGVDWDAEAGRCESAASACFRAGGCAAEEVLAALAARRAAPYAAPGRELGADAA